MTILDLQRRMVEAGRIRAGEKGDKGQPRKLDKWRLTSKDKVRLDAAAVLWGGTVQEWAERPGEFELYTTSDALPIMLLPGQEPTTWYELWSKGGCQRRCDGRHEMVSDAACLCGEERECKPYTRLSVLLPDLPGIGSWMLSSTGWNAAAELAGAADLLQRASAQGVLIPARLRLEQRVQVKAGQTHRFAVPVIDLDVSFRELLGGGTQRALEPATYTPLASIDPGVSVSDGLEIVDQAQVTRTTRSAAPIAATDAEFGAAPLPEQAEPTAAVDDSKVTADQKKALNALWGQLSEAGHITVEQVYAAVAKLRSPDPDKPLDVDEMITILDGRKQDGSLSFSRLRDSLTKQEASNLVDRLGRLADNAKAPAA